MACVKLDISSARPHAASTFREPSESVKGKSRSYNDDSGASGVVVKVKIKPDMAW